MRSVNRAGSSRIYAAGQQLNLSVVVCVDKLNNSQPEGASPRRRRIRGKRAVPTKRQSSTCKVEWTGISVPQLSVYQREWRWLLVGMGDWDTMDQRGCVMKFVVAEERFPETQRLLPWWTESERPAYGRREFPVPLLFWDSGNYRVFRLR